MINVDIKLGKLMITKDYYSFLKKYEYIMFNSLELYSNQWKWIMYWYYVIPHVIPSLSDFYFLDMFKVWFDQIKYNYSDYKKDFDWKYIPMRIDRESRAIVHNNQKLYNSFFSRDDWEIVSMEFYKDISIAYFNDDNKDSTFEIYNTAQIKEHVDKIYKYWMYRQHPILKQLLISEFEYRKEKSTEPDKFQLLEDKILPVIERWEKLLEENWWDEELVAEKFMEHLDSYHAKLI